MARSESKSRYDPTTGRMDLDDLRSKIGDDVAAVYIEIPSYLGVIETATPRIAEIAHPPARSSSSGSMRISLGVLAAPADYGADIVVGRGATARRPHALQRRSLRVHRLAGRAGIRRRVPLPDGRIAPGRVEGEWGFGWSTMERTSYDKRENAHDYTGTTQWLWGITAAVYLSLLGPQGMREVGEGILQRSHYAMQQLSDDPRRESPAASTQPTSRNSSSISMAPARAWPRSTRRSATRESLAGTISPANFRARAERALLRHGNPHPGRYRPARRGDRGGDA